MIKAKPKLTDREIIKTLGVQAIVDLGFTEMAVIQWRTRGVIPWKARTKVEALATKKKTPLPADFALNRPEYPSAA